MFRIERSKPSEQKLLRKQLKFIRNVYEDGQQVRESLRVELDTKFDVR